MISKSESLPITIETNILLIIPLIYSPYLFLFDLCDSHLSSVILSLTTLHPVKRFVATLRRQRWKQRHFALVEKSLMTRPSSSLSSILQRDLRSHHPSLRDLHPRLLTSISPTLQGGRLPTQALGSYSPATE